jgi:hypothetical protein
VGIDCGWPAGASDHSSFPEPCDPFVGFWDMLFGTSTGSEIDSRLIGRADLAGCFEQRQVATLLSWTLLSAFPGGVHDPAGIVDHLVPVQEPDVQGDQSATQCSQTLAFVISNIGQK